MIIKSVSPKYINQIVEIENDSFITPWPKQILADYIKKPGFFCNIAINGRDEEVAGYSISTLIYDEIHVFKIAVSRCHRRKGVAIELLSDTFNFYEKMGALSVILEVRTTNAPAIELYKKLGFEIIRTRKNYYGRGRGDAYVMGLALDRYYQKFLSAT